MGFGTENNEKQKDSFDEYLSRLSTPKQKISTENNVETEDDDFTEIEITQEDVKHKQIALEASKFTANIVVETIDVAFSEGFGIFAKLNSEEKNELKADDDIKETLVDAWSNYLKDKGGELSPGILLIILVLGVYAPKIPLAFEMRKMKIKNAELESELDEKDREIAKLQKQLKQKTTKK
jgi:hypothetical protein